MVMFGQVVDSWTACLRVFSASSRMSAAFLRSASVQHGWPFATRFDPARQARRAPQLLSAPRRGVSTCLSFGHQDPTYDRRFASGPVLPVERHRRVIGTDAPAARRNCSCSSSTTAGGDGQAVSGRRRAAHLQGFVSHLRRPQIRRLLLPGIRRPACRPIRPDYDAPSCSAGSTTIGTSWSTIWPSCRCCATSRAPCLPSWRAPGSPMGSRT